MESPESAVAVVSTEELRNSIADVAGQVRFGGKLYVVTRTRKVIGVFAPLCALNDVYLAKVAQVMATPGTPGQKGGSSMQVAVKASTLALAALFRQDLKGRGMPAPEKGTVTINAGATPDFVVVAYRPQPDAPAANYMLYRPRMGGTSILVDVNGAPGGQDLTRDQSAVVDQFMRDHGCVAGSGPYAYTADHFTPAFSQQVFKDKQRLYFAAE
ncbi:MAG TPA: hypothetical protein VEK08_15180 [Planctomycetota bacterium]|nr:hypothetical protein [Planctomycetota bacterium]